MTDKPIVPTDSLYKANELTLENYQKNPTRYLCSLAQLYGDVARYRLTTNDLYLITNLDLIRLVLVEQADKFQRTAVTKNMLGKFLGEGMLITDGGFHRQQRRTVQPIFTPTWIQDYTQTIVESTDCMLATWQDGEIRNITQDMRQLHLHNIGKTIFGIDLTKTHFQIMEAIAVFQKYSGQILRREPITVTESEAQTANEQLDQAVLDLLNRPSDNQYNDLLSLLARATDPETNAPVSGEQIRAQTLTFLVAGNESTASSIIWACYLLAQYPHIEAQIYDELRITLNGKTPTKDNLPQLDCVEKVLKEALRLYPPVWTIGRRAIEPIKLGDHQINTTDSIIICPYVLHHNGQNFSDPEQFDPERFSQENEKKIPKYAYLPFGAGPHVCIGQPYALLEGTLILSRIIQQYQLRIVDKTPIEIEHALVLRPKNGLKLQVIKRPSISTIQN